MTAEHIVVHSWACNKNQLCKLEALPHGSDAEEEITLYMSLQEKLELLLLSYFEPTKVW